MVEVEDMEVQLEEVMEARVGTEEVEDMEAKVVMEALLVDMVEEVQVVTVEEVQVVMVVVLQADMVADLQVDMGADLQAVMVVDHKADMVAVDMAKDLKAAVAGRNGTTTAGKYIVKFIKNGKYIRTI